MSLKKFFGKIIAKQTRKKVDAWKKDAVNRQNQTLLKITDKAKDTQFGKDHDFSTIKSYSDFKKLVPVRDYEALKPYFDRLVNGEADIFWPGLPKYFSKTSGTTSGTKYIPISKESMGHHLTAARDALLLYISQTGNADFVDGKMIFLQGSPVMTEKNGIATGRLSGIVAHHIPAYLQKNRLPSLKTNSIDDWETKVDAIIDETINEDMTLISGIPSWVQFYFERILTRSGKQHIKEVFPNFNLFVYGGVNFEPYRSRFEKLIGKRVDSIETYPSSEGFIAFQDDQNDSSLLLNVDAGIFFEFIPAENYFDENPPRISLAEVEVDKNYALILSTNAGLWAYSIGDTVKFTSLNPYKILVTGRIKHFTSAFGEHVIAEEVEAALREAVEKYPAEVIEFTVAPELNPTEGLPYHEWFIAFAKAPENMTAFAESIDKTMQKRNAYYADLINGKILRPLRITSLKQDAFNAYMKSQGKLGGQNKVPRLSNDRKIADVLTEWREK
ncbi:GH3 auxin-responsive promoter family protein [Cryomorpha ignava]|uniref:GH3 auxin-responsive promoter family protein n=1 Tax=Cryomorpha ignava TaxID=101383 RepID=A0A7K3WSS6_9FLAO|nr:GH3 auxin-responsive promoter family protein [Cryomorpha ignava]NEN24534.1 GH3 auxin-responsive promoter family protein [Cryomorpha ignava]